jgi:hypothetical protein
MLGIEPLFRSIGPLTAPASMPRLVDCDRLSDLRGALLGIGATAAEALVTGMDLV